MPWLQLQNLQCFLCCYDSLVMLHGLDIIDGSATS